MSKVEQISPLQEKGIAEFIQEVKRIYKPLTYSALQGDEKTVRENLQTLRGLREKYLPILAEKRAEFWAVKNSNDTYALLEDAIITLNYATGANLQRELAQHIYDGRQPMDAQTKLRYERIIKLFKDVAQQKGAPIRLRNLQAMGVIELTYKGTVLGLMHPDWLFDKQHNTFIYKKNAMSLQDLKHVTQVIHPTWSKVIQIYLSAVDLRINIDGGK